MADNRPNLLWIMTDQHRADCLGFMGHPCIRTPNLDALASESVVFENAFCQSPVCMASRGALFTGRYPQAVRIHGMGILPPSETTLAEVLKRNGYHTAAFGKVHFTPEKYVRQQLNSDTPIIDWRVFAGETCLPPIADDPCKINYGFDTYVGCDDACQGPHRRWLAEHSPALLDAEPARYSDYPSPADLYVSAYPSEYHQTTFIGTSCADWLASQDDGPWFAFCSFVAPHHPFEAPADQISQYSIDDIPLPDETCRVEPGHIPPPISDAVNEMVGVPEIVKRRIVLHYLASVSLIDENVGRLLELLRDAGKLENTVIVFVADHGEFLGNRGLLRKPSMHYDELLRVPLVIRLPDGTGGGRRVPGMVELVDVMPTCLGLLGVPQPPGVQGIDWSCALRLNAPVAREEVYSDMYSLDPMKYDRMSGPYGSAVTLRTASWKLTIYPDSGPQYGQLFNIADDPAECRNLYGDPEYSPVREEMLWRLASRFFANRDPLPLRLTQW